MDLFKKIIFWDKSLKLYREISAEKNLNIPNAMTAARILSFPAIAFLITERRLVAASIVFTAAAITDWLDGYLARKYGQTTKLGELLDPVADKLLVAVLYFLLPQGLWMITFVLIIFREIGIVAGRFFVTNTQFEAYAKVNFLGKTKAAAQYFGVVYSMNMLPYYNEGMFVVALFSVGSLLYYVRTTFWNPFARTARA